jgi:hypothetical protein
VLSAHSRNRSEALPVQWVHSAIIARTEVASGSASRIFSTAALRFAAYAAEKVPAGQRALSHAAAQSAKFHARQGMELDLIDSSQPVHRRVQEDAQDKRPRRFKLPPKLGLSPSIYFCNWCHSQKYGAVAEVRTANHILNSVQQYWAGRLKQHLLAIGVEPPYGETAAGRKPADGVREPMRQAEEIIEGEQVAVIGRDYAPALLATMSRKISSAQVRAARALLRWTAIDLARSSKVGVATIRRAEVVDGEIPVTLPNESAIRRALEAAGIVFIEADGGGEGVRFRKPQTK